VDGQRTQAKCGDGNWIRALTTRGTVAGGRWRENRCTSG
jgi:hypothetical protein